jgi:hypothetical protein
VGVDWLFAVAASQVTHSFTEINPEKVTDRRGHPGGVASFKGARKVSRTKEKVIVFIVLLAMLAAFLFAPLLMLLA